MAVEYTPRVTLERARGPVSGWISPQIATSVGYE